MTLGFSKFHQQVPLTKFLGTTKYMKRNKIVIFHIKTRQFFVHNILYITKAFSVAKLWVCQAVFARHALWSLESLAEKGRPTSKKNQVLNELD